MTRELFDDLPLPLPPPPVPPLRRDGGQLCLFEMLGRELQARMAQVRRGRRWPKWTEEQRRRYVFALVRAKAERARLYEAYKGSAANLGLPSSQYEAAIRRLCASIGY